MVSEEVSLRRKVKRQGKLIDRLSKGKMRFSPKRIMIWKEGKIKNWIDKREYGNLSKELSYEKTKIKDKFKLSIKTITFKKQIITKRKRKEFDVITYTKTQRKFIAQELKKRKIPVSKKTKLKTKGYTDLKKAFEMKEIKITPLHKPSP